MLKDGYKRKDMKILIVEDEEAQQKVLAKILKSEGHDVVVARNGTQALHFLERDWLDIVLTDMSLPGMSGLELLRQVQAHKYGGWTPKIILMSGFELEFPEGSLLPRPDYFLLKPFTVGELLNVVNDLALELNTTQFSLAS